MPAGCGRWKSCGGGGAGARQVIALVGSLFQGIAYQPVILLIIALQCGLWTYLKRCEEAAAEPRSSRRRAAQRSEPQRATSASNAARSAPASEA